MSEQNQVPIGTIGWIDLTASNADEVRDFYQAVVGWNVQEVPMGDYADYSMIPPGSEEAVAGICHKLGSNDNLPSQWLMYITVADVDESIKQCEAKGGKVVVPLRDMGAYGRFCVVQDPAGAVAGLMEPKMD